MVQTFMVIQCVNCETFQVHQVQINCIHQLLLSLIPSIGEKVQQQMDVQGVRDKTVSSKGKQRVQRIQLALASFCTQKYFEGQAAECRKHVQELNLKRGEFEKAKER